MTKQDPAFQVDHHVDLELRDVTKVFSGGVVAVDQMSLQVHSGELVSLLGPSGCGKTTTLRMIAGFEPSSSGQILIKNVDMDGRPPYRRDIGLVFQNYSLFPHMTAAANVAYGLKMRKVQGSERARRVADALEMVGMSGLGERYPSELSGGQQQRVALARALVIRPSLLLLDEPLSNLDAKLRYQTRWEIRRLQQELGITTVFVTHDQEEALTISDRVAVMNHGKMEQLGTPRDLYRCPQSLFVADFIGDANILSGTMDTRDAAGVTFVTDDEVRIATDGPSIGGGGSAVVLTLRPEAIAIFRDGASIGEQFANRFPVEVNAVSYLGGAISYRMAIGPDTILTVTRHSDPEDEGDIELAVGDHVVIAWRAGACRLILPE